MQYYLGLPMWSNQAWRGAFYTADAGAADYLAQYSSVFNSVEGNSTFYALPDEATVRRWSGQPEAGFRFCFKFPRLISHDAGLKNCDNLCRDFFGRLAPLRAHLGPLLLQLPESFAPDRLDDLEGFLRNLPAAFSYSVELRHADFFTDNEATARLNRLLQQLRIGRVCFDSRALFALDSHEFSAQLSNSSYTQEQLLALQDAQRKKPHRGIILDESSVHPVLRFIGQYDQQVNLGFLQFWIDQVLQWMQEGKQPYIFLHTPDNRDVYQLASSFHQQLCERSAGQLKPLARWPAQRSNAEGQLSLF